MKLEAPLLLRKRRTGRCPLPSSRARCACEDRSEQRPGRAAGSASLLALASRGFPAVLGLVAPSPNSLRSLRSLHSNSRDESVVEARCARGPQALRSSAAQRRCAGCPPEPLPRHRGVRCRHATTDGLRGRRYPAGAISAATRSAGPGSARAQHVLRQLTHRGCLSAVSTANEASSAMRPRTEHRSAVGAKRRPPQHEPLPGTACRDAHTRRGSTLIPCAPAPTP
jgi:hypothetical protein